MIVWLSVQVFKMSIQEMEMIVSSSMAMRGSPTQLKQKGQTVV